MINQHTYLGRTIIGSCCVLLTTLTKDMVESYPLELKPSHFTHVATDWGGVDDYNRVCKLHHLKPTGEKVSLTENPLKFEGIDYDMGHEYRWSINVVSIELCEVDEQSCQNEKIAKSVDAIKSRLWFLKNGIVENIHSLEDELSELEKLVGEGRK